MSAGSKGCVVFFLQHNLLLCGRYKTCDFAVNGQYQPRPYPFRNKRTISLWQLLDMFYNRYLLQLIARMIDLDDPQPCLALSCAAAFIA